MVRKHNRMKAYCTFSFDLWGFGVLRFGFCLISCHKFKDGGKEFVRTDAMSMIFICTK